MQKKLLLVLAIVACGLASHAQVQKGDWLLGGTLNLGTNNGSSNNGGTNVSNSGSNSNISPELGWGIGKNSVLGFRGGIGLSSSKDDAGDKFTYTNYSAGAFWKKFFTISEKAGWLTDLSAGYTYNKSKYTYVTSSYNQTYHGKGWYASLSPGVYYKPSKKIFLTAGFGGLSYNYSRSTLDLVAGPNASKSSGITLSLLNYYTFGISFLISSRS